VSEPRPHALPPAHATGGRIKVEPEDFEVEELPAYLPEGRGEHLFIWVEKRDRDTQDVAQALAQAVGVPVREVSYAGMKDRRAVTRQFMCVPAEAEGALAGVALAGVRLLHWKRHTNRLRTGHLRGNRFRIRLRQVRDPAVLRAGCEALVRLGVPNYFGDQRFGQDHQNAAQGKRLLLGERLARSPSRFQRKLFLSAYQSLLFNRLLAARVIAGTWGTALTGDVLRKADTGGCFVCEDVAVDQPRVARFELSPAGPMFGPKLVMAAAGVAAAEQAALQAEGLTLEHFRRGRGETEGSRRPYRIPFDLREFDAAGQDATLAFDLPKGSYATVVLQELLEGEFG